MSLRHRLPPFIGGPSTIEAFRALGALDNTVNQHGDIGRALVDLHLAASRATVLRDHRQRDAVAEVENLVDLGRKPVESAEPVFEPASVRVPTLEIAADPGASRVSP